MTISLPGLPRILHYGNLVNRACPLNRGLFSWWIDLPQRGKGNTFFDIAGTNHGTLINGPTRQGPMGRQGGFGSLLLDGSDDRVETATIAYQPLPATIYATFRRAAGSGGNADPVIFGHTSGNFMGGWRMQWISNVLNLVLGGVALYSFTGLNLSRSVWYQAAIAISGDGGTANGYLRADGGALLTASASIGTANTSADRFVIGDIAGDDSFDGHIDDCRCFNSYHASDRVAATMMDSRLGNPLTLNRVRPYTVFDMGGAPPGGSILSQMLNNGLFVGSAA